MNGGLREPQPGLVELEHRGLPHLPDGSLKVMDERQQGQRQGYGPSQEDDLSGRGQAGGEGRREDCVSGEQCRRAQGAVMVGADLGGKQQTEQQEGQAAIPQDGLGQPQKEEHPQQVRQSSPPIVVEASPHRQERVGHRREQRAPEVPED